ncbi:hypothetical protein EC604_20435 [Paenibacillus amylolyticus]|uniref:Uncharacterized protein n=1 Tax=Paenibacillus amylolyticus TaxID=1451 RepID=A0A5M9WXU8_PAEAM|nr:hypothetical protein [Paenibacillus amylolyticus]KAA8786213.1 hypothetical protein EC604_20435 [Paenibacillus amylolyticus]
MTNKHRSEPSAHKTNVTTGMVMYKGTSYPEKTFQDYLVTYASDGIRLSAGTLVLFFLNVFLLIPIFSAPYQSLYAYLLLPPLAIMNLWAIVLIIAPRRLQLNYVLFRGVFGLVCSVSFMVGIQKFAYGTGMTTAWYVIGSFVVYVFTLIQYVRFRLQKLKQSPRPNKIDKNFRMPTAVIAVITGGAYLMANISLAFVTEQTVVVILICVYNMLIFVVFHFVMDLHRYYWLRRVMNKPEVLGRMTSHRH